MSTLTQFAARLRHLDLERSLNMRPPYPPVALQVERDAIALVRLKPRRRGRTLLEALHLTPLDRPCVPASIFESPPSVDDLVPRIKTLFERTGTRPGRVSLVLPDNLAKVTLLRVPERPASRRQLDELVRSQIRRGVPFKLDDARLSYQELGNGERGLVVLVVVVRRGLVEQYEEALARVGARVGLVDLVTPNLINLCRQRIVAAARSGGDVALLNCDRHYFTLAIVRAEQLIFLRCKTYVSAGGAGADTVLLREVSNSFSYYQDKLRGRGVSAVLLRDVRGAGLADGADLARLGLGETLRIEPTAELEPAPGKNVDAELALRLAPAIGAAAGRV